MSLHEDHIIRHDLSTVGDRLRHLEQWCEIATEVAGERVDAG